MVAEVLPRRPGEPRRLEHLARFLDTVADVPPDEDDLLVLGPGTVHEHLAAQLRERDRHRRIVRDITCAPATRLSRRQLVARLRRATGEEPPRGPVGGHRRDSGPEPPGVGASDRRDGTARDDRGLRAGHRGGDDLMRVLLATDGSPAAGLAVDLVAGIDWPAGTSVRVVEAIQVGADLYGGVWPASTFVDAERLEAELRQTAVDTVEGARSRLVRPGLDVSGEVLSGRAANAIVEAAGSMQADLIVLGSRGHGTIESMVLGSVSAEVVDHAQLPVLVARDGAIARVVLGWDGSAAARAAADLLLTWPMFSRSAIRVVSVADIGVPWWTGFPQPGSPETAPMVLEAAEATRTIHDRDGAGDGRRAPGRRPRGRARATRRRRCDGDHRCGGDQAGLIVLGTHGRTGLARLVLGSVARNVLHHATCSVLVTRGPDLRSRPDPTSRA